MNKKEFIETYKKLGNENIEKLYCFSCLKYSGFYNELAFDLAPILRQMWLDDINNNCISLLSDILYEYYFNKQPENIQDMNVSDILTSEEYERNM